MLNQPETTSRRPDKSTGLHVVSETSPAYLGPNTPILSQPPFTWIPDLLPPDFFIDPAEGFPRFIREAVHYEPDKDRQYLYDPEIFKKGPLKIHRYVSPNYKTDRTKSQIFAAYKKVWDFLQQYPFVGDYLDAIWPPQGSKYDVHGQVLPHQVGKEGDRDPSYAFYAAITKRGLEAGIMTGIVDEAPDYIGTNWNANAQEGIPPKGAPNRVWRVFKSGSIS